MDVIDKTVNRVLKWESVDISISGMVSLIQSEILDNATENDLLRLEKGMRKSWVLGVGSGFATRFYPASDSPVRICCQFNVITHQIQQISLMDSLNKKEYFIETYQIQKMISLCMDTACHILLCWL